MARYFLETLDPATSSTESLSISNSGHLLFSARPDPRAEGVFVWHKGKSVLLRSSQFTQARALDVNASGIAVGGGSDDLGEAAHMWVDGEAHALARSSREQSCGAQAVNDDGIIVGYCHSELRPGLLGAAVWRDGKLSELFPSFRRFDQVTVLVARAISNSGLIVGEMDGDGFIFDGARYTHIPAPVQDEVIKPLAVNDGGVVVGGWYTDDEGAPFRWTRKDGLVLLGTLSGSDGTARDINNAGVVVGDSTFRSGSNRTHGFVYADGAIADLNDCTPERGGWVIEGAAGINDAGQIAATASNGEMRTAVLLTPE